MEISNRFSFGVIATFALVFAVYLPVVQGHAVPPVPAPTSDGTAIDQGIAYVLMLLALVLTYIIHALDSPISL